MDATQIRQEIAKLPATAQSKPILDAMMTLLEASQSSSPGLATMRQEIEALKAKPAHNPGLCGTAACQPCQDSRIAVAHQAQEDFISLFSGAAEHYGLQREMSLLAEAVKHHRAGDAWDPTSRGTELEPAGIEITP